MDEHLEFGTKPHMNKQHINVSPTSRLGRALLALLALAVAIQVGYYVFIGVQSGDVGPFETVLARAVAGHFEPGAGPGRFYGPYDGGYPSVVMHAPFYYRLVALLAWPFVAAGFDGLNCALVAGRLVSVCAGMLLLAAVWGWARLGGRSVRAGLCSVGLVASSPVVGSLLTMLRPDVLGVAMQTAAGLLVVGFLEKRRVEIHQPNVKPNHAQPPSALAGIALLTLAGMCFALAIVVKQHNLMVALVCGCLLIWSCRRGELRTRPLMVAAGLAMAFAIAYLCSENLLTGGLMWKTVFVYPSGPFRGINYAGWVHVRSVFEIVTRRSLGLILLAGISLCVSRGRTLADRVDRVLFLLLLLELALLVPLCLYNAGAAYNYALQAIVFAGVLVGRGIDRTLNALAASATPVRALVGAGAMGSLLLIAVSDAHWVLQTERLRRDERVNVEAIRTDVRVAAGSNNSRYFVARQHLNRLDGNPALIHDDWLYGAFERAAGVEPRNAWLKLAITEGPITQVIVPDELQTVPGVDRALPELGYHRLARFGDLTVWSRAQ
jgi:hypothetical protein